jgi:hypothetical protein
MNTVIIVLLSIMIALLLVFTAIFVKYMVMAKDVKRNLQLDETKKKLIQIQTALNQSYQDYIASNKRYEEMVLCHKEHVERYERAKNEWDANMKLLGL